MNELHAVYLAIHIIGTAIIVGTAFIALVSTQKRFASAQVTNLVGFAWKIAMYAIIAQLITGILMGMGHWSHILHDPYFLAKMTLLLIGGAAVGIAGSKSRKLRSNKGASQTQSKAWAVAVFLVFVAIAALGVVMAELHTHNS